MSISKRFSQRPAPLLRIAIPAWRSRIEPVEKTAEPRHSKHELIVLFRDELGKVGAELCPGSRDELLVLRNALCKADTAA